MLLNLGTETFLLSSQNDREMNFEAAANDALVKRDYSARRGEKLFSHFPPRRKSEIESRACVAWSGSAAPFAPGRASDAKS